MKHMTVGVERNKQWLNYLYSCFQEQHFVNLTSKIRAIRPDADVKIPNYWAVMLDNMLFCYEAANYLRANPNLWLKDDLGQTSSLLIIPVNRYLREDFDIISCQDRSPVCGDSNRRTLQPYH